MNLHVQWENENMKNEIKILKSVLPMYRDGREHWLFIPAMDLKKLDQGFIWHYSEAYIGISTKIPACITEEYYQYSLIQIYWI